MESENWVEWHLRDMNKSYFIEENINYINLLTIINVSELVQTVTFKTKNFSK